MAIPPPPPPGPPGPPPPPMGGLKLGSIGNNKGSGGGDTRSALLQSIQMGAKLKKTVTVDKSGPLLSGKVASNNNGLSSGAPSRPPPPSSGDGNGMPKLGGIFGGMSTMPKLKPVGGRGGSNATVTTNRSPPESTTPSDNTANSYNNSNGPALDFNAELTNALTLKKQKKQQQQQQQQHVNATEANLKTNRGPPPQPPNKGPTISATESNTTTSSYLFKQQQQKSQSNSSSNSIANVPATPPPPPTNGLNLSVAPNKSSLFGKGGSVNNLDTSNSSNTSTSSTNSSTTISTNNSAPIKPVPNHGKPNCAPKPPGIQQIIAAKNGVSRHHSMRSPRSPPISLPGGPVFPSSQHFGTMRGPPQMFQSQDAINSTTSRQPPIPTINRPTVAPPRPPNNKPPPPPIRSVSNTNLTTLPLSVAPSSVSAGANTSFGSASNVSTLKEQYAVKSPIGAANSVNNVSTLHNSNSNSNSTNNTSAAVAANNYVSSSSSSHGSSSNIAPAKERSPNGNAPPLPPHRTCPAPPPPMRQTSNAPSSNLGAPPVPQRNSSMRNSNSSTTTTVHQSQSQSHQQHSHTVTRTVNRLVVDIDAKFGHVFHNVTEFPPPSPFTNLPKSYPSRNVKTGTGMLTH